MIRLNAIPRSDFNFICNFLVVGMLSVYMCVIWQFTQTILICYLHFNKLEEEKSLQILYRMVGFNTTDLLSFSHSFVLSFCLVRMLFLLLLLTLSRFFLCILFWLMPIENRSNASHTIHFIC